LILLTVLLSGGSFGHAREAENHVSFCGGMFYQAGWSRLETPYGEVSGFSSGLGGKLGFYLSPGFRLGAMGFSASLRYDKDVHAPSSYTSAGAGGLTAEKIWRLGAWRIGTGIMLGGGRFEHLHILSVDSGTNTVGYDDYRSFLASPLLSAEYPLSEKITAMCMADWLFGNAVIAGRHYGPSLRLGILFTH
jgi:hypothetical protein